MNVFIYYFIKTLMIHLDNIVAIIFQKTNLPCQGRQASVCSYMFFPVQSTVKA